MEVAGERELHRKLRQAYLFFSLFFTRNTVGQKKIKTSSGVGKKHVTFLEKVLNSNLYWEKRHGYKEKIVTYCRETGEYVFPLF